MSITGRNASKQVERRTLGFLKCSLIEYEIWEHPTCFNNENSLFFFFSCVKIDHSAVTQRERKNEKDVCFSKTPDYIVTICVKG